MCVWKFISRMFLAVGYQSSYEHHGMFCKRSEIFAARTTQIMAGSILLGILQVAEERREGTGWKGRHRSAPIHCQHVSRISSARQDSTLCSNSTTNIPIPSDNNTHEEFNINIRVYGLMTTAILIYHSYDLLLSSTLFIPSLTLNILFIALNSCERLLYGPTSNVNMLLIVPDRIWARFNIGAHIHIRGES